jgi:hypothetical protein
MRFTPRMKFSLAGIVFTLLLVCILWKMGTYTYCPGFEYYVIQNYSYPNIHVPFIDVGLDDSGNYYLVLANGVGHPLQVNGADIVVTYSVTKLYLFSAEESTTCYSNLSSVVAVGENFAVHGEHCAPSDAKFIKADIMLDYNDPISNETKKIPISVMRNLHC